MTGPAKVLKFDAAAIAQAAAVSASAPPDAKRPLFREMPAAEDYPVAALGVLRDAAEAIQMKTKAPVAICGQSVLAAAALAIAPHYDAVLLTGPVPLTVLCLTVAESGERKSSVDKLALRPVREKELRLEEGYGARLEGYKAELAAWKAATEKAKKKGKNREEIYKAIQAEGAEPKPPAPPALTVDDASAEGLTLFLAEYRPYGGLFSDEGGKMLGGYAMSKDSKTKTAALFNALWGGAPITCLRVLTGNSFAPGRRFSMHLMVQPMVSETLLHDAELADIGLLARMLVVSPESTIGTRLFKEADPVCDIVLRDYGKRMAHFLDKDPPAREGGNGLAPDHLPMSAKARKILISFHDEVEGQSAPGGTLAMIKGFAGKMAEHAGRLAAVLAAYADPKVSEIDTESMENGITLARYYAGEMKRLADGASIAPDLKLAGQLLDWWKTSGKAACHLAEIYQRGPIRCATLPQLNGSLGFWRKTVG